MVTLNDYKASSIKVRNICSMKTTTTKSVKRVFPLLGHSYNAAWIHRLEEFEWDLLLKESADIKCAMYDIYQHVELYRNSILFVNLNNLKCWNPRSALIYFGAL